MEARSTLKITDCLQITVYPASRNLCCPITEGCKFLPAGLAWKFHTRLRVKLNTEHQYPKIHYT